ncbi:hypothetical protein COCON_G00007830 [Conger conger]|uniref:Uncharacterized protein n=1 Tax=Conger conger TaxID=82655 RepID=A0A9Q1E1Z0_CONCO|nr:hypothetical protein COCON_G00007830 [Conger conger]
MVYTFKSDDHMVITIPISSIRKGKEEQLLPQNFHCVFKDAYKVFLKGNPKALGTAQLITGMLIISMGLLDFHNSLLYTLPSVLFIFSGMLSYAAGHSPNMCVTKLSFSLNIMSLCLATATLSVAVVLLVNARNLQEGFHTIKAIQGMIAVLISLELGVAMTLIYFESKAVCRAHFNILPVVNLKLEA